MGSFTRNIITHIRGILFGSLLIGILAAAAGLVLPANYLAQSTVRVIPPAGQRAIDPAALETAVDWYLPLADVSSINEQAAVTTEPPLSAQQVKDRTTMVFGQGPGDIWVRGLARDPAAAISLSNAMATAVVAAVANDETMQLGRTSLSVLVPAGRATRTGTAPWLLFVTGFLVGFVLVATAAGILHRHLNWRLSPRMLSSIAEEIGVPAFTDPDELAAFLVLKARTGPQAWLATAKGVPTTVWSGLRSRMGDLADDIVVVPMADDPKGPDSAGPGVVYAPDPNNGSPTLLGEVAATGAPALLVVPTDQRARSLRRMLRLHAEFGVRPLALTTAPRA